MNDPDVNAMLMEARDDEPDFGYLGRSADRQGTEQAWNPDGEVKPAAKTRKRKPRSKQPLITGEGIDIKTAAGRTDMANARRLLRSFGEDLHYCGPWKKWLEYDGRRWQVDSLCKVEAYAKTIAKQVWLEAAATISMVEHSEAIEIVKFAKMTSSAFGIGNMIKMARSEPGIAVAPNQLDGHTRLFNVANGTIDLVTGKLIPHDRTHLITKLSNVNFTEWRVGSCPVWEKSLKAIFRGDLALVGYIQRLFGLALIGEVIEHILAIFYGGGSNGKSLLTEMLLEAFGEFGDKCSPDLLLVKDGNAHPTEKADLHGKRLIFATETDSGRRLSEATTKELTGGDTIHARRMREDFWSFKPSHTAVLVSNHKPRVLGTDHGIWRRLQLVPFEATFWDLSKGEEGPPELEADKGLKAKLRKELPGILGWLVQGCLEWQRVGLKEPDAVRNATKCYRTEMDVVGCFIAERCAEGGGLKVRAKDLYAGYMAWCESASEHPMNQTRFGSTLADKGFQKVTSNGVWYLGLDVCESF